MSHIVRRVPSLPPPAPIHLKPAAPLADRVLLPGDPHRALAIAQAVLEGPRMFNHHRGLWGYTGEAADGAPLTVQATGMGGPSAAIVVEELIRLGATTLVRVGTCGALDPSLSLGDLLAASAVHPADGASAALGATEPLAPAPELTEALRRAAGGRAGPVVSSDLFYDERPGMAASWRAQGAVAVEMEAAAILRLAERRGVRAACLLAVSDLVGPAADGTAGARVRIGREELEAVGVRLGEAAAGALRATDR